MTGGSSAPAGTGVQPQQRNPDQQTDAMVDSLIKAIDQANAGGSDTTNSKAATAIAKLSELVKTKESAGSGSAEVDLENNPAFKKMRTEVDKLQSTVGDNTKKLDALESSVVELETTAKSTDRKIDALGDVLERLEGKLDDRGPGPARGHFGAGVARPIRARARGGAASAGVVPADTPLLSEPVTEAVFDEFLAACGVGVARVQSTKDAFADNPDGLPYERVWGEIMKLKVVQQWKDKLAALKAEPALYSGITTKNEVGQVLWAHLNGESEISADELQPPIS